MRLLEIVENSPKGIVVVCSIFLIFGLALLIPSIIKGKRHPHPDEELIGEEGGVSY